MNLSPAYLQQCEAWKQEGKQEGTLEGQSLMVASLLEERFGTLDEEISNLIPALMQLPLPERTRLLFNLSNLSREELIARLSGSPHWEPLEGQFSGDSFFLSLAHRENYIVIARFSDMG